MEYKTSFTSASYAFIFRHNFGISTHFVRI